MCWQQTDWQRSTSALLQALLRYVSSAQKIHSKYLFSFMYSRLFLKVTGFWVICKCCKCLLNLYCLLWTISGLHHNSLQSSWFWMVVLLRCCLLSWGVCVWSCGSKTCVVSNLSIECGILCSVQSCNGRALGNNNVRQMAYILSSIIYCRPKYDDAVCLAAKHTGSL